MDEVELVVTGDPDAFDDAMTLSGKWMSAGSPSHEYVPGKGNWCGECGCGEGGIQHHAGPTVTGPDAHWPYFDRNTMLIRCQCGESPTKRPTRMSTQHIWHQTHRRRLGLQPVEYMWPNAIMDGPSTGGYVRVQGHEWRDGRWQPIN